MRHATWGGPSGIVHGWTLYHGAGPGWMPVCYPNGAHPGWPEHPSYPGSNRGGHSMEDGDFTTAPIDCKRCLKKLGRRVRVLTSRRVVPVERAAPQEGER